MWKSFPGPLWQFLISNDSSGWNGSHSPTVILEVLYFKILGLRGERV